MNNKMDSWDIASLVSGFLMVLLGFYVGFVGGIHQIVDADVPMDVVLGLSMVLSGPIVGWNGIILMGLVIFNEAD